MGRRTLRAPRRKQTDRPSTFFLLALAVGIVLVITMYILMWSRPMKVETKPKSPAKKLAIWPPQP